MGLHKRANTETWRTCAPGPLLARGPVSSTHRSGIQLATYVRRTGDTVWVTPPPILTDDVVDHVLADLRAQLSSRSPRYAVIFDLSRTGMPNAVQRQKIVSHLNANRPRIHDRVLGLGIVPGSALARGIVTAIFWVAPPAVPYRSFGTREEAGAWARSLSTRLGSK
jgi:hypothetical protein